MKPNFEHEPLLDVCNQLCKKAYSSWHLVSCPTLAKVTLTGYLKEYDRNTDFKRPGKLLIIKKLLSCYIKSVEEFILILCRKAAHVLSRQKADIPTSPTVFVDSYLVVPNIFAGCDILDNYFPGLEKALLHTRWDYTLLPRFSGSRNPFHYLRMFIKLRKEELPVMTEFQLLKWIDYLHLVLHLFIYPWYVLALLKYLPDSREGRLIHRALVENLTVETFSGAMRYLVAKRLASTIPKEARFLQWFENQTYERCLNRGLRNTGVKTPILGAQLFLWPTELLNIHVDENEQEDHMPDIVFVNGPYYVQEKISERCKVGPSIRYSALLGKKVDPHNGSNILVLLPYFEDLITSTIEMVTHVWPTERLVFKFHPASNSPLLRKAIPEKSRIVGGNFYDILEGVGFVIGTSTGSLIESAAIGIPVISLRLPDAMNYSYMPDIGQGLLWETADSVDSIKAAFNVLSEAIVKKQVERQRAIQEIKNQLFSPVSNEAVLGMLDAIHFPQNDSER